MELAALARHVKIRWVALFEEMKLSDWTVELACIVID